MSTFVSYTRGDMQDVEPIVAALRNADLRPWLDTQLGGGRIWWQDTLAQLRLQDVFVVAVSPNWHDSNACRAELDYARALGKPIVAVLVGGVTDLGVPESDGMHVVKHWPRESFSAFDLITATNAALDAVKPLPVPLPEEPPVPYSKLSTIETLLESDELDADLQVQAFDWLSTRYGSAGLGDDERTTFEKLLQKLHDHDDVLHRVRRGIEPLLPIPTVPEDSSPWSRRKISLIALASIATIAVVATAVTIALRGHSAAPEAPTTSAPKLVAAEQLPQLLLDGDESNAVMGLSNLSQVEDSDVLYPNTANTSQPCIGTVIGGTTSVYTNTGYAGVARRGLQTNNPFSSLWQTVISFPDTSMAQNAFENAVLTWSECTDQVAVLTRADGTTYDWRVGAPVREDSLLTTALTDPSDPSWVYSCRHALRVVTNVVLEAVACGERMTDEAVKAVDEMVRKT